jgi:hypothetical protein
MRIRQVLIAMICLLWPISVFGQNGTSTGNLILNAGFEIGGGLPSGDATPHSYKIATLHPNNGDAYDHLHLVVTLNRDWGSTNNSFIDATFANRAGFEYQYTLRGAPVLSSAKLAAYQNSDTTVDIYLMFSGANTWTAASYTFLENLQETLYTTPIDSGASVLGTLVFDSSSPNYLPATYTDFSGNQTIPGNLKLTVGSGASITFPDNTVQSTAWTGSLGGGDYAESVDVSGDRKKYEPGDVLVIDPRSEGKFLRSAEPYSTNVMGIYSTKPGLTGRRQLSAKSPDEVPMAMMGIVPTKVSAENGPIRPGDLLVTSSMPGFAMKATDRRRMVGALIGKSLGRLDTGVGVIEVGVTLQ